MDFLDPQKERAHRIRLFFGYGLIAIAIGMTTLILLYQASGYGLNRSGQVIQNGLVFISSHPSGAKITFGGKDSSARTDTKQQLEAGQYKTVLERDGYHSWQRIVTVEGGSVQHFDYPFLVPNTLNTSPIKSYGAPPTLATESPDRHWLLVSTHGAPLTFEVYDLSNPKNVTANATNITLPESVVDDAKAPDQTWSVVEWSNDNRHVLVNHGWTANGQPASEYILLDRQDVAASINLTKSLTLDSAISVQLVNKKYDKYYLYNQASHVLTSTTLSHPELVTPVLEGVLAFKSYGDDTILYTTDKDAPDGKVITMLKDGNDRYKIREQSTGGPYLVEIAQYGGDWYIVCGSSADNKVYVYQNPQQVLRASAAALLVPVQILKVTAPNYVAFSSNTEHIMVENGRSFADYDAETDKGYTFTARYPLDQADGHASWMDSSHLAYVSQGKLVMFDYDNINDETLVPAEPGYQAFFDRNYNTLYTIAPTEKADGGASSLTATSMLTPADQ